MHHPSDNEGEPAYDEPPSWGIAVAIGITIIICIAAFIWIFVRLEPYMSDFVSDDSLATPTVVVAPEDQPAGN